MSLNPANRSDLYSSCGKDFGSDRRSLFNMSTIGSAVAELEPAALVSAKASDHPKGPVIGGLGEASLA